MNNKEKIGVGIITCNRPDYLSCLLNSFISTNVKVDELLVINDGDPLVNNWKVPPTILIQNEKNLGVCKTKNKAMQYLLDKKCDHIFIIEDDVEILSGDVFNKYIKASKETGILHFNYGPGTPFNRKQHIAGDVHDRHLLNQTSNPNPRLIVDYKHIKLALYLHIAGTFSYFNKKVLEVVGLFDEQFYNAWEHVEHTLRIAQNNFHPPFWWFADIADSDQLLQIQESALDNSSISTKTEQWYKNLHEGREKYKQKHGWYPNENPQTSQEEVLKILKQLKKQNG